MDRPRMTAATLRVLGELHRARRGRYCLQVCHTTGLASGTVHPILRKFEELGWLESQFEDIDPSEKGRPARRYYRFTAQGRRWFGEVRSKGADRD